MELHPMASIVEMDTVIGTTGGKGGKCFLTMLFRNFNFMPGLSASIQAFPVCNRSLYALKKVIGGF